MMNRLVTIRALDANDRGWVTRLLEENWGSAQVVTRGHIHQADRLSGFAAILGGQGEVDGRYRPGDPVGLVTYKISNDQCEVVSLNSLVEGLGIGTRLLEAVIDVSRRAGCARIWLITSNDNTAALRFYQRRGWRLAALHRGAIDQSRLKKPSIPPIGIDGIPIHDEIELEFLV